MWIPFTCVLDNDFIVLADQERMMDEVTKHVTTWLNKHKRGPLLVETFYNRQFGKGVVYCIATEQTDYSFDPLTFTTNTHVSNIIFHTS